MQRTAGIEAKPSQPEHGSAKHHIGNVGRCIAVFTLHAPPQKECACQCCHTRRGMHHNAARKVHYAPLAEQPLGVPCAVRQGAIDEQAKQNHEHEIGGELHPLGKGARNERRRNDGKLHLKQGKQCQRYGGCQGCISFGSYALEHEEVEGVAYHAAYVAAKTQTEADHDPHHAHHAHGDEALQYGGDHILLAHHAAVEEGKSRRHHEHKNGGGNHPRHIGTVNGRIGHPSFGIIWHHSASQAKHRGE